jgi:enterochelin esterase-like enzyme
MKNTERFYCKNRSSDCRYSSYSQLYAHIHTKMESTANQTNYPKISAMPADQIQNFFKIEKLIFSCSVLILIINFQCLGQIPKVSSGTIQQFADFPSKFVAARNIDVWLPADYDKKIKYSVLYMHDGKALFDSTIMWNKQEWGVDETLTSLIKEQKVKPCIVVGIYNSEATRQADYFPQKAFELLTPKQQEDYNNTYLGDRKLLVGKVQSDNYLKFIVNELKPFIDSTFNVYTDASNTFIAGSSYGGLISLYAICEYPNIFGGAACLSTHWPGIATNKDNPIPNAIMNYMKKNLPEPKNHKIYFDYGNLTLDSLYRPLQLKVDKIMKAKGYTQKNWVTKEFIGDDHSEKSWNERLYIPFTFLLSFKD